MKREMRKVVSAVTTVAMVATLFSGVSFDRTANAATGDSVALKPWKFYQTGTTTDSSNPWELNAFKSVTFGNSGVANLTESSFTHYDVWSPEYNANPGSDEKTVTAGGVTDTFSAFIESNGWQLIITQNRTTHIHYRRIWMEFRQKLIPVTLSASRQMQDQQMVK